MKKSGPARLVGILSIVFGVVAIVAGITTWVMVSNELAAEKITVSSDSAIMPGATVNSPITAYAQAEVIQKHSLEGSGGKTYAELGTEISAAKAAGDTAKAEELQAQRTSAMNASFLRASLFTSVVAFGVALLVVGLGIMFLLIGWALLSLASPKVAPVESGAAQQS
jgi:cell division septal protein FtsQ